MANTYPQPDSNAAALNGQDYLRIRQTLFNQGAIFESSQGCHMIGLGPDSDISRVTVVYPDLTTLPGFPNQNTAVVSSTRAFNASLYAAPPSMYSPSNRPQYIMFYSTDLVADVAWTPTGFDVDTDQLLIVRPVLDVIQYFTEAPSVTPARNDRVFEIEYYQWMPSGGGGSTYIALPYYGRQSASIAITNKVASSITVSVSGVNFSTSSFVSPQEKILVASGPIAANASQFDVLKASSVGTFDLIYLQITSTVPGVTRIIVRVNVSDQAL